jgi:hypothetical protein
MDLGEVGWDDVDWIGLAKDRNRWRAVVNVLNLVNSLNYEDPHYVISFIHFLS